MGRVAIPAGRPNHGHVGALPTAVVEQPAMLTAQGRVTERSLPRAVEAAAVRQPARTQVQPASRRPSM
jgi:hypothetical protein